MLLWRFFSSVTVGLILLVSDSQSCNELVCAGVRYPWHRNHLCCGVRVYNRYTEVCCEDEQVVKRHHGHETDCCGAVAFDSRWQSCCAGHVVSGAGMGCCGRRAYSKHNATCCEGELLVGLSGLLAQCCSAKPYNPLDGICCKDRLWPRLAGLQCCGSELYNSSSQFCVSDEIFPEPRRGPNYRLCGKEQFDRHVQTCCNLYVPPILNKPGTGCCGTPDNITIYNISTQHCCEGIVQKDACGVQKTRQTSSSTASHSTPAKECVNGEVIPRELVGYCKGGRYNVRDYECCNGRLLALVPGWSCCGDDLFDPSRQRCDGLIRDSESQRVLKMCGRNSHYDPSSERCCLNASRHGVGYTAGHTCCNGTVYPTPGTSLFGGRCCDGEGYNPDTEFCCSGEIMSQSGWQRIGENSFLEDTMESICCEGEKFNVLAGEVACQGVTPYNPKTQMVCGGVVHTTTRGQCCGESVYTPDTHVCCSGYSHLRPDISGRSGWVECCGTQPYDITDPGLRCCGNRLHRLPHSRMRCCGDVLINASMHGCCSSEGRQVVHHLGPDTACCGHLPYNTSIHSCSRGRLEQDGPCPHQKTEQCAIVSVKDIDPQVACNHTVLIGQVMRVTVAEQYTTYTVRQWPHIWGDKTRNKTQNALIRLHSCHCPVLSPLQNYAFWVSSKTEKSGSPLISWLISSIHLASDVSHLLQLLTKCPGHQS